MKVKSNFIAFIQLFCLLIGWTGKGNEDWKNVFLVPCSMDACVEKDIMPSSPAITHHLIKNQEPPAVL